MENTLEKLSKDIDELLKEVKEIVKKKKEIIFNGYEPIEPIKRKRVYDVLENITIGSLR